MWLAAVIGAVVGALLGYLGYRNARRVRPPMIDMTGSLDVVPRDDAP